MMIELGKQYRTRDGEEVRIYAVNDDDSHETVHGAILYDGLWYLWGWHKDGRKFLNQEDGSDLIEVKEDEKND